MSRNIDPFEYDVALSFASQDRAVAEELANLLSARKLKVLSAEAQATELGGGDFVTHIAELYRTKARYCILLFSEHYPLKKWTEAEQTSAREHALRDADEYIYPLRLDDTDVPGITAARGYQDLRQHSMKGIVDLLDQKLSQRHEHSGPPPQSHDLRSGNVPSTDRKS
ncbi:MAG TPA: TIR domain-containing protein [Anaerolineales bacterium]|nr:TIR domain-containing protein [Anaerolineales bacterium]